MKVYAVESWLYDELAGYTLTLRKNKCAGEGALIIRGWFFTHPKCNCSEKKVVNYQELSESFMRSEHIGEEWILSDDMFVLSEDTFIKGIQEILNSQDKCCICGKETKELYDASPFMGLCCEDCRINKVQNLRGALLLEDDPIIFRTDNTIEFVHIDSEWPYCTKKHLTEKECANILDCKKADVFAYYPQCVFYGNNSWDIVGDASDTREEKPINKLLQLYTYKHEEGNGDFLLVPPRRLIVSNEDPKRIKKYDSRLYYAKENGEGYVWAKEEK